MLLFVKLNPTCQIKLSTVFVFVGCEEKDNYPFPLDCVFSEGQFSKLTEHHFLAGYSGKTRVEIALSGSITELKLD